MPRPAFFVGLSPPPTGLVEDRQMARKKWARVWSAELREGFLARLRVCGNARASARAVGQPHHIFHNQRRRDPGFRRAWDEAAAAADAGLKGAGNAFPGALGPGRALTPDPSSRNGRGEELPTDAEALGGYLRPGRKPKGEPEPVIRRCSNGRWQISLTREGHWTSAIEARFLARLRATGNFHASALSVGFQPASVHERVRKWTGFAEAVADALEQADVEIGYRLTAHAHALATPPEERGPGEPGADEVPFDPDKAMKALAFLEARKHGRIGRGTRKAPPQRSFDEAVRSVLDKIEAIERWEARRARRAEEGEAGGG